MRFLFASLTLNPVDYDLTVISYLNHGVTSAFVLRERQSQMTDGKTGRESEREEQWGL